MKCPHCGKDFWWDGKELVGKPATTKPEAIVDSAITNILLAWFPGAPLERVYEAAEQLKALFEGERCPGGPDEA